MLKVIVCKIHDIDCDVSTVRFVNLAQIMEWLIIKKNSINNFKRKF